MDKLDRRSAIVLGAAIVAPLVSLSRPAAATMYAADADKEIMPGIRQIELGEWPIGIGNYKKAKVSDFTVVPGEAFPEEKMMTDMICHILEGEFWVKQGDKEFTAKTGHVFTCAIDSLEEHKNTGSSTAVMRVIELMPA